MRSCADAAVTFTFCMCFCMSHASAQPANNVCSSATLIPGNVAEYNPPLLNTAAATTSICDAIEDCDAAGTSNSVWYQYTPSMDGSIRINTFGSNYDTVLSVFDGCATGFIPCNQPNELACNDNVFLGTQSEILLEVKAGQEYIIKAAGNGTSSGGGLLDFNLFYIPPNDLCTNPMVVVGTIYDPPVLTTDNAQTDLCEVEESCEFDGVGVSNSVWYSYLAPCDGFLTLDTDGSGYDTVLSVFDGCGKFIAIDEPCQLPTELACDDDAGIGTASKITDLPIFGGNEYIIKVADYNTTSVGGDLDFNLQFTASTPPEAEIAAPSAWECVCDSVEVVGTADDPDGFPVQWTLDYAPLGSSAWTTIASGSTPVIDDTLAIWNTAALTEGDYVLRLTVGNGCGASSTAVTLVHRSDAFDTVVIDSPAESAIVGGLVCFEGTVKDENCFNTFDVSYRPQGGGSFNPVTTILNDQSRENGTFATWQSDEGPGDDIYEILVTGTDSCANTNDATLNALVVDNTDPTAEIDSPITCGTVEGLVTITGTADDANLAKWVLQYSDADTGIWQEINSGTSPVVDGVLGNWDTTGLPKCAYALRLIVEDHAVVDCDDTGGHRSEALALIEVGVHGDFDYDGDGDVDAVDFGIFQLCVSGPTIPAVPECLGN